MNAQFWLGPHPDHINVRIPISRQLAIMLENRDASAAGITEVSMHGKQSKKKWANVGRALQMHSLRLADEDLNAQPVNTLPVDRFLRTMFVEGKVIELAAPKMFFLALANRFTTTSREINWFRHKFTIQTDPKLKGPGNYNWGDEFPRTIVSDPELRRVSLSTWAEAIEFTYDAIRYTNTAIDDIMRKVSFVAQKFALAINEHYANVLTNDFAINNQAGFEELDQVNVENVNEAWTSDDSNPEEDIRNLIETMENRTGHYNSPTILYLHSKDFRRLKDFYTRIDRRGQLNPLTGEELVRVDQVEVVKVPPDAGLPRGNGIMLDRNPGVQNPLSVWDDIDPRFSTTGVVHTRQYENPESLNRIFLFHKTHAAANRNAPAVGLLAGLG